MAEFSEVLNLAIGENKYEESEEDNGVERNALPMFDMSKPVFYSKRWHRKRRLTGNISYDFGDCTVRLASSIYSRKRTDIDTIPICRALLPSEVFDDADHKTSVLKVALRQFPTPDTGSCLADVIEFKREVSAQQWHFRRFLSDLAGKKQSESEIQDYLEWMLYEYTQAMKIHHLKAGDGFIEVYIVPLIELSENIIKFNWTNIARGLLAVDKRHIQLLESEANARGRECAYVFEAQKRFGPR